MDEFLLSAPPDIPEATKAKLMSYILDPEKKRQIAFQYWLQHQLKCLIRKILCPHRI